MQYNRVAVLGGLHEVVCFAACARVASSVLCACGLMNMFCALCVATSSRCLEESFGVLSQDILAGVDGGKVENGK